MVDFFDTVDENDFFFMRFYKRFSTGDYFSDALFLYMQGEEEFSDYYLRYLWIIITAGAVLLICVLCLIHCACFACVRSYCASYKRHPSVTDY